MTVNLENNNGDDLSITNGTFELLTNCGAGLLAGWAPSWRKDATIYLNDGDDNFSFEVNCAQDCKLFGRLLRVYVRVLEVRCTAYEKRLKHAVRDKDRNWGPHALLKRSELPHLIEIAEFFERSEWVKRTG